MSGLLCGWPVDAELTGPLRTKNSLLSKFIHILEAILQKQGHGGARLCNKLIGNVEVTLPQAYLKGLKRVIQVILVFLSSEFVSVLSGPQKG